MPSQPESHHAAAEPPAGGPPPIDFKAVARVSTQAQLKSVRLRFIHADMVENEGPIPPDWTSDVLQGLVAELRLEPESGQLMIEIGFLAVYAPGIDPETDELPDPKDAPVELHARFRLDYELEDASAIDESDAVHFAMSNAVLHAVPYWRELAQSTTVRMGLSPLMVGTMKFPWTGDPKRDTELPEGDSAPPASAES